MGSGPILLKTQIYHRMAATAWKVGGRDQEMCINIECSNLKNKQNIVHNEVVKLSDLVSNENLLEFRLDFDELQELHNMSKRPHIRNMSSKSLN